MELLRALALCPPSFPPRAVVSQASARYVLTLPTTNDSSLFSPFFPRYVFMGREFPGPRSLLALGIVMAGAYTYVSLDSQFQLNGGDRGHRAAGRLAQPLVWPFPCQVLPTPHGCVSLHCMRQ